MNMARYELLWEFEDGACIEYEDPWGYHILMYQGTELTSGLKCISCWFVTLDEWYWQDERGLWHRASNCQTNLDK